MESDHDLMAVTLTPADWERLRTARLRALADAPDSFGASLDEESAWSPEQWQGLLRDEAWGLVRAHDDVVGLANVRGAMDAPDTDCWIRGWWVAPGYRGGGVSRALLDWADGACLERHWPRQGLGIWCDNAPARALFARLGFTQVGGEQSSEAWGSRCFVRMLRTVPSDQALESDPR